MRGRPPKPLAQRIVEGERLSQTTTINRDAPEPPRGPMDPPADLPEAQVIVWRHVIANQAAGVFRPIDTGALRQYAWFLSHELAAEHEFEAWASAPKKTGETPFLKRARNGALVAHPLLAVIRDLHDHVLKLEVVLGLTPVARERIHASVQGELFGGGDPRDPWASFKTPDEQKAN